MNTKIFFLEPVKLLLPKCLQVGETSITVSWSEVEEATSWTVKFHPEEEPNNQAVSKERAL